MTWAQLNLLAACLLACAPLPAAAQPTPHGLWLTFDDATQRQKSVLRISDAAGALSGHVEHIMEPRWRDAVCTLCTGEQANKPVLGLQVLRDVRPRPDEPGVWDGGDITDPENGKTYRVRLQLTEQGQRLLVRGYIGPFYRSQVWQRTGP
jgi:uncharacterized protein (DUF2147 family)